MRRPLFMGMVVTVICALVMGVMILALLLYRSESSRVVAGEEPSKGMQIILNFGRSLDHAMDVFYRGPVAITEIPPYSLDIADDQLQRMMESIPDPLSPDFFRFDELVPWVPAVFRFRDGTYDVHIRVVGDAQQHWMSAKKSWDIRFADDAPFEGTKGMVLTLPEEKGLTAGQLLADIATSLSVPHAQVGFATLSVNGGVPMLYARSIGWEPSLVAKFGFPSDVQLLKAHPQSGGDADVAFEDSAYWVSNTEAAGRSAEALDVLRTLSQPGAADDPDYLTSLAAVMDLDRLTALLTVRQLAGNPVAGPDDIRLAFDPATGEFVPIIWNLAFAPPRPLLTPSGNSFLDEAMRVPAIRLDVQERLWKWLQEEGTGSRMSSLEAMRGDVEEAFYRDSAKRFSNRQAQLGLDRDALLVADAFASALREVTTAEVLINQRIPTKKEQANGVTLVLDLSARGPVAAELEAIQLGMNNPSVELWRDTGDGVYGSSDLRVTTTSVTGSLLISASQAALLWPGDAAADAKGAFFRPPHRRHRFFLVSATPPALPIEVVLRNAVTGEAANILGTSVIDNATVESIATPPLDRAAFLRTYPSFRSSGASGIALSGTIRLRSDVLVPPNLPLTIAPGTDIEFDAGVSLVTRSAVHAIGTVEQPIRFLRSGSEPWGSVAIIDASDPSDFAYIEMDGGSDDTLQGVLLDSMLLARGSPVSIGSAVFRNAGGNSAVHIAHVFADVNAVTVEQSAKDGIHIDHALAGVLRETSVDGAGRDGIVLTRSPIIVRNSSVRLATDACIRAADRSAPILEDTTVQECGVGLAALDGSQVMATRFNIVKAGIGVVAERTAPGQPLPSVSATETILINNGTDTRAEEGATITIH